MQKRLNWTVRVSLRAHDETTWDPRLIRMIGWSYFGKASLAKIKRNLNYLGRRTSHSPWGDQDEIKMSTCSIITLWLLVPQGNFLVKLFNFSPTSSEPVGGWIRVSYFLNSSILILVQEHFLLGTANLTAMQRESTRASHFSKNNIFLRTKMKP